MLSISASKSAAFACWCFWLRASWSARQSPRVDRLVTWVWWCRIWSGFPSAATIAWLFLLPRWRAQVFHRGGHPGAHADRAARIAGRRDHCPHRRAAFHLPAAERMNLMAKKTLVSWSSGKDSAWALHVLRQRSDVEVVGLMTTMNQVYQRIAIHAV